ncbi:hypothetical protein DICVIV_00968 [Dictyocaulus viviparus]|uniref:Uncharacterized protein n=1 Tax=Dictyocaulus viviparus TaxID=29172 RepID=A0A0D8YDT1_DICVI|nr:hypothetical protein DICVIV_00968 [Dictyocaulus viviparus]
MHRTSVRKLNVHLDDENQMKGKNNVLDTPRRALGDMKNMTTPDAGSVKGLTTIQKPGLQLVSTNLVSSAARARNLKKSCASSSAALPFDIDEDVIEQCTLKEDNNIERILFEENSVILSDQENEAEYFEKLFSTTDNQCVIDSNDDEEIETCGWEDEVFDCREIMNNADSNAVLTDDYPSFPYERPDMTGLDKVKRYTLQEMEDLFDSYVNVAIL